MAEVGFNSTVPETAKPRLGRQQKAILEALRVGPVTNTELLGIGMRFGARIQELRKAGYEIATCSASAERGCYLYTLLREP